VLNPAILFPIAGNVLVVVASAALLNLSAYGQVNLPGNNWKVNPLLWLRPFCLTWPYAVRLAYAATT